MNFMLRMQLDGCIICPQSLDVGQAHLACIKLLPCLPLDELRDFAALHRPEDLVVGAHLEKHRSRRSATR